MAPASHARLAVYELPMSVFFLPPVRTDLEAQAHIDSISQSSSPPPVAELRRSDPGVNNGLWKLSPDMVPICLKTQSRSKVLDKIDWYSNPIASTRFGLRANTKSEMLFYPLNFCAVYPLFCHTTGLICSPLVKHWIWLEGKIRCPGWQTYT